MTACLKPVVLVVEDEPLLRMMAVDLVEDAGFDAVEAASADEAVHILESRLDIRVVFTDIDMPGGQDGLKLALAIRDRWPPIEIIITSGKRMPLASDMPERGVFFAKPYKRDEVMTTMRRMAVG
jgi:CheY-like chemotaxis protein